MNTKSRAKAKGNYAFIDNQNLNLGIQKLGWKMDWRKFRKFLAEQYGVTKAYMFIGHMPEHEDMYLQLHDAGYLIVLKPTFDMSKPQKQQVPDKEKPEDKKPVKGNVDAELVLWAVKEMKNYQKAVIVSGDGDFYSLIEYLEAEKKLLHLLAPNTQYSSLYNKYEEYVQRLDKHRQELSYRLYKKANGTKSPAAK
ncbi:NYN domain-containing protein [Candidatus Saccharibacteria bacterium]|nr:MAG: NYN domain-containing protein [Candidatus Saccharibacteria bacterium]